MRGSNRGMSLFRTIGIATAALMAILTAGGTQAQNAAKPDPAKVEAGENVYNDYCQTCHGQNLVSTGQTFDLRKLKPEERERFLRAVLMGKGQMPPWKGVLEDAQIDAVWAYVMSRGG